MDLRPFFRYGCGQTGRWASTGFRLTARRAGEPDGAEWQPIQRGWCFGTPDFKAKLLEQMDEKLGEHHAGELKRESTEAKAERIIWEELKRRRWTEADLKERAKSDPAKLALAARVRRETTLTIRWIAGRLHLETWKSLNAKLHLCKGTGDRNHQ